MAKEFKFEVIEKYGILSETDKTTLELRKIRWNYGDEKYDIRRWSEEKPLKGITLSSDEMQQLFLLLGNILGVIDVEE